MSEFFHMGGYAVFVWSAYGVAAFALVALTVGTILSIRNTEKELADLEAIAPRRRRRAAQTEQMTENQGEDHA